MAAPVPAALPVDKNTARFSLAFGIVLTLAVSGYQFGRGNHTVYLLDGLRAMHPELLRNDWFSTKTLQYHACFSLITECLLRLHMIEPAFLVGYLTLVILWHLFWRKLVLAIGGDDRVYLISVFLFYLSAAGISLGVFQFLQDGCFLPSNVANVAMLGGIACWVSNRKIAAGAWLGVAGLFHVNYAVVAIGLWVSLLAWEKIDQNPRLAFHRFLPACLRGDAEATHSPILTKKTLIASLLALLPSLLNLGLAVPAEFKRGGTMPMGEFVSVYVRFRHTHHFDPLHWPEILWISFLWPLPFCFLLGRRWNGEGKSDGKVDEPNRAQHRALCRIFALLFFLLVIAFLFAGVWFMNEPLVQLCLWRFSIYNKLISCIAAGCILCDPSVLRKRTMSWILCATATLAIIGFIIFNVAGVEQRGPIWMLAYQHRAGIGIVVALFAVLAIRQSLKDGQLFARIAFPALLLLPLVGWTKLGVGMTPEPDDERYREVCVWAKDPANTPIDAIFLVPAQETDFRLYAQRAIVVNFKHVPQLSGEIVEWKRRLLDVLGAPNVEIFGHDYTHTLQMIESLYEHRSAAQLFAVAGKYGARYVVVNHSLGAQFDAAVVFHRDGNPYIVYDLTQLTTPP